MIGVPFAPDLEELAAWNPVIMLDVNSWRECILQRHSGHIDGYSSCKGDESDLPQTDRSHYLGTGLNPCRSLNATFYWTHVPRAEEPWGKEPGRSNAGQCSYTPRRGEALDAPVNPYA